MESSSSIIDFITMVIIGIVIAATVEITGAQIAGFN
jgi:hypothetical protein